MHQRLANLRGKHPDRDLLVTWNITRPRRAAQPPAARRRRATSCSPSCGKHYGTAVAGRVERGDRCDEPLCVPAEWYDEETIRGDVLRQFRELETNADIALDLEEFLPRGRRRGRRLAELAHVSAGDRGELLLAASKLGIDLLSVDEDEE